MAVATATNVSNQTGRSTTINNSSAQCVKPGNALKLVTIVSESTINPRAETVPDASKSQCRPAHSGFDLLEQFEQRLKDDFQEIYDNLMIGISQGELPRARAIASSLEKLAANRDKVENEAEVSLALADLLGPDFDWNKTRHEDQHTEAEPAEAGIDVGPNVDIAGREPE